MQTADGQGALIEVINLREFFRDSLQAALQEQHVSIDEATEQYIVNVLTVFARSEELFERTPEGLRIRPLAHMLAAAAEAPTPGLKVQALRRLGDVSLFVAGFFAQGFARKLTDIDYHIAMGGRAYGTLAAAGPVRGNALATIFDELSAKFHRVVDALNDVAEMAYTHTDRDILRLYEVWLKTGSPRARSLLGRLGIAPTPVPVIGGHH